jgi:hypothetical protein
VFAVPQVISVHDTVNVADDQDLDADPFVAQVTRICHAKKSGEKLVRCRWLFRARDIPADSLATYLKTHGDVASEVCFEYLPLYSE